MISYLIIAYSFFMTCDCVIGFWKSWKYTSVEKKLNKTRIPSHMIRLVCIFTFVILTAAFHKFRFTPDLLNVNIFATVVLCATAFYTRFYEKSLVALMSEKIEENFKRSGHE